MIKRYELKKLSYPKDKNNYHLKKIRIYQNELKIIKEALLLMLRMKHLTYKKDQDIADKVFCKIRNLMNPELKCDNLKTK